MLNKLKSVFQQMGLGLAQQHLGERSAITTRIDKRKKSSKRT